MAFDSGLLLVLQTILDRKPETSVELHVERICGTVAMRGIATPTPMQLDDGLQKVGELLAGATLLSKRVARNSRNHSKRIPRFDPEVAIVADGDPKVVRCSGQGSVAAAEALAIEVWPAVCEYWSFQLRDNRKEFLDCRHRWIHANKRLVHCEYHLSVREACHGTRSSRSAELDRNCQTQFVDDGFQMVARQGTFAADSPGCQVV